MWTHRRRKAVILMADDDQDNWVLMQEAAREVSPEIHLRFVQDGVELMDCLHGRSTCHGSGQEQPPNLILLDGHMPRKSGVDALAEIKADPFLRSIPVVMFTRMDEYDCISKCYALGANSFIRKPGSFDGLIRVLQILKDYWFGAVTL